MKKNSYLLLCFFAVIIYLFILWPVIMVIICFSSFIILNICILIAKKTPNDFDESPNKFDE